MSVDFVVYCACLLHFAKVLYLYSECEVMEHRFTSLNLPR